MTRDEPILNPEQYLFVSQNWNRNDKNTGSVVDPGTTFYPKPGATFETEKNSGFKSLVKGTLKFRVPASQLQVHIPDYTPLCYSSLFAIAIQFHHSESNSWQLNL